MKLQAHVFERKSQRAHDFKSTEPLSLPGVAGRASPPDMQIFCSIDKLLMRGRPAGG